MLYTVGTGLGWTARRTGPVSHLPGSFKAGWFSQQQGSTERQESDWSPLEIKVLLSPTLLLLLSASVVSDSVTTLKSRQPPKLGTDTTLASAEFHWST